ncbi:ribosome biogenesis GTP-binding protein YihA/YsxC [Iodobacter fluviatilis]|uniref:Probable GTP-binding protein EngB n=1 Tax=Iodobacter fluviatilis TaxID=537 RepID=A0A377SRM9_9NEIS|nr:ribosome biogenesis GTP-binding protein YihA/YsxC [Iodobacter fluviatilis]TCU86281.1 cell division checkpoint GTPase YihA [Iodobacter fluviatilis]STR44692.1 Probable GTP-binding protein EngB [Iodobacter fluviatilis]
MSLFQGLQFLTTVNDLKALPADGMEVAFAGRSNAGKSSAINTLANHTRLAFVSKTPGRTQHINYFQFGNANNRLVDLPGYGYAEVPVSVRQHWERLLSQYLVRRSNLIGLVLIMDSRRPLTELDRQMLDWFRPTGKPIHCILTKCDKLNRQEQTAILRKVEAEFADESMITVQLFSSSKKLGTDIAEKVVGGWFDAMNYQASQAEASSEHSEPIDGE